MGGGDEPPGAVSTMALLSLQSIASCRANFRAARSFTLTLHDFLRDDPSDFPSGSAAVLVN